MRPLLRSSLDEEIASWFVGGGVARAFFTSAPADGEALRFDIVERARVQYSAKQPVRRDVIAHWQPTPQGLEIVIHGLGQFPNLPVNEQL